MVNFIVVNAFSPYTAILARPWIHAMCVVPSMLHVNVKFPIEQGIVVVKGDQKAARQCLVAVINHEIKQKGQVKLGSLQQLQCPEESNGANNAKDLVEVKTLPYKDRYFWIGKSLPIEDRVKMLSDSKFGRFYLEPV